MIHPSGTRTWPQSTRRTIEGSIITWMRMWKGSGRGAGSREEGSEREQGERCARLLAQVGTCGREEVLLVNVSAGANKKVNTLGRRRT